jgi:hypothetical protein
MLSNWDRRRLAEIEALLREDDPGFVQRFVYTERRSVRRLRPVKAPATWWVIAAVASFASWAVDNAVLVVIALTATSVALCMWSFQADLRAGLTERER